MKTTPRSIGLATAISLVVANMVGSGIYTSLGFQLQNMQSLFAVLMLWVVGGIVALCGSLVYGELGAAFPHNGGEYNFLSQLYSPLLGFLSGWISAIVGFAAPVAAVCIALGNYLHNVFPALPVLATAVFALICITAIHAYKTSFGARFQQVSTLLNVGVMLLLIISGLSVMHPQAISVAPSKAGWQEIVSNPSFVTNLYWVSYAYTGWNAASYIAGEIKQPGRNLPLALITGSVLVMLLYVCINYAFLYAAPVSALQGQLEVGFVATQYMLGSNGAQLFGIIISISLISTISAMTFAGPRVTAKLGHEVKALQLLGRINRHGVPSTAVVAQSLIALVLVLLNQFQLVIDVIGFTLSLSTSLTVAGVFILRRKHAQLQPAYRTWGYPVTPIVFLLINAWILYYGLMQKWQASLGGLLIIAAGAWVWWWNKKSGTPTSIPPNKG
jgi:basic amino acid/polyamine antiporter, APA family